MLAAWLALAFLSPQLPNKIDFPPLPPKKSLPQAEAKMESSLLELVTAWEKGGAAELAQLAQQRDVRLIKNQVRLRMILDSVKHQRIVSKQIRAEGGQVTATFRNNVYALLPVSALRNLAAQDKVITLALDRASMRPMPKPVRKASMPQ